MGATRDQHALIADELERFVRENSTVRKQDAPLDRDVDLFESGHLTSLGGMALIAFIESRFRLRIPDEDVLDQRFGSINGISTLIVFRLDAAAKTTSADG